MSRIGKQLIVIPEGVIVEINGSNLAAKGPMGEQAVIMPTGITASIEDGAIKVIRHSEDKKTRSLHGLYRVLINNIIQGVKEGFVKSLEFKGIGYKVAVEADKMIISAGYSHPVELIVPEDLKVTVAKSTIKVSGVDKYRVGQFAAKIREVRKPEVYKGKGFRYSDEHIRIKPGKTAAKA